jgi:coat protein B
MFKKVKGVLVPCLTVAVSAVPALSFAALSAADQTSILAGISASDSVFYAIGGGILVVMAGIWGFRKVQGLLGR